MTPSEHRTLARRQLCDAIVEISKALAAVEMIDYREATRHINEMKRLVELSEQILTQAERTSIGGFARTD